LKRPLLWLCLLLAAAATGVLGVAALRDRPVAPPSPPAPAEPAPPEPPPTDEARPRRYETTGTLTEDLRDALSGPPEALAAELRRVAALLRPAARTVLLAAAPREPSPRVRALLVFAAGLHVPDEDPLLAFLDDREPVVRRAAALAAAYLEGGERRHPILEKVEVPIGRPLPDGTRRRLEERSRREEEEGVRGALGAALGLSSPTR
jgi:hypothetical protein